MVIVDRRPNLIACAAPHGVLETFGQVLQRRRLEKGWTVSRLAREAGVNRVSIERWEDDQREPHWPFRLALREALGLSADDDRGWWAKWE